MTAARCPICGKLNYCPCPLCKAKKDHETKRVIYFHGIAGRNGKPDTVICGNCGFEGEMKEWEMQA